MFFFYFQWSPGKPSRRNGVKPATNSNQTPATFEWYKLWFGKGINCQNFLKTLFIHCDRKKYSANIQWDWFYHILRFLSFQPLQPHITFAYELSRAFFALFQKTHRELFSAFILKHLSILYNFYLFIIFYYLLIYLFIFCFIYRMINDIKKLSSHFFGINLDFSENFLLYVTKKLHRVIHFGFLWVEMHFDVIFQLFFSFKLCNLSFFFFIYCNFRFFFIWRKWQFYVLCFLHFALFIIFINFLVD